MGAYGYKLYDSDEASDLKSKFNILLNQNQNVDEITKQLIDDNQTMIEDSDEAPIFWCVIADLQWGLGRLNNEIKEKAMYYLKNGFDLERWRDEDESSYKKRQRVADKLLEKLESPQPPPKRIRIKKPFVCDWKIGDVFAYKLDRSTVKYDDIDTKGEYVIFQKVDDIVDFEGNIVPIVRFYLPYIDSLDKKININNMIPLEIYNYNWEKLYRCVLDIRKGKYYKKENLIELGNYNIKEIKEIKPDKEMFYELITWNNFSYWIYLYRKLFYEKGLGK